MYHTCSFHVGTGSQAASPYEVALKMAAESYSSTAMRLDIT